jgi:hypothetical protein
MEGKKDILEDYKKRKYKVAKKDMPVIEKITNKMLRKLGKDNYKEKIDTFFKNIINYLKEEKFAKNTIRVQLSRLVSEIRPKLTHLDQEIQSYFEKIGFGWNHYYSVLTESKQFH